MHGHFTYLHILHFNLFTKTTGVFRVSEAGGTESM